MTLLFIGGAIETVEALEQAVRHGHDVAVVDGNEQAPGIVWARANKQQTIIASTYNSEAIIESLPYLAPDITGGLAVGCDVGPTVSAVARHLHLPHIPHEVSLLSWDKHLLKQKLAKGGIKVPRNSTELAEPSPLVIKPIGGRGGRGVEYVADSSLGFNDALNRAAEHSPTNQAIAEEYLPGFQISSETIVYDGHCWFTGLTDRAYNLAQTMPRFIEFGGIGPSLFDYSLIGRKIRNTLQKCVDVLGIRHGTIKGDIVVVPETFEPYIIELAIGRLSGGYNCTRYLPIAYGVDFFGAAMAVYQGLPPHPCLVQRQPLKHIAGGYTNALTAKHNAERGEFRFTVADSRQQVLANLAASGVDIRAMLPGNPTIFDGKPL